MPLYMILCHGALSKENVVFLPRLTNSMEQNPTSETSSRSTTERFDSDHKGQAVVQYLFWATWYEATSPQATTHMFMSVRKVAISDNGL